jgi:hypothetical protein
MDVRSFIVRAMPFSPTGHIFSIRRADAPKMRKKSKKLQKLALQPAKIGDFVAYLLKT